jgi:hypothetical protein
MLSSQWLVRLLALHLEDVIDDERSTLLYTVSYLIDRWRRHINVPETHRQGRRPSGRELRPVG